MTIQLPGIADQIGQGGMEGIGNLIASLVNPDWQRQQAVRQAVLSGRINPDQLNNMGSSEVEQVFGKGTGGFAAGEPTAAHVADTTKAAEIQRILTSGTPQEKEELLSNLTGTKTTTERTIQQNAAALGTSAVDKAQRENERLKQGEAVGRIVHARLGTDPQGIDLYAAAKTGKISGDELNALLAVPEYEQKYNRDREDFWQKQHINIEQQRVNAMKDRQFDINDYMLKVTAARAGQVAEKYGTDPKATMIVMQDPMLRDKYIGMDKKSVPASELPLYEAAQALKSQLDEEHGKDFIKNFQQYRLATQKAKDILANPASKVTPEQKKDLLNEINTLGKKFLGNEAPVYKYDTNGPDNSSGLWGIGKTPTLYRASGDVAAFGTNEPFISGSSSKVVEAAQKSVDSDPLTSWRGKNKDQIDKALMRANPQQRAVTLQALIKAGIYK